MAGSRSLEAVLVLMVVATVLVSQHTESASVTHHNHQRLVRSSSNDTEVRQCSHDMPCGWAVYIRFTRQIDYFMKNSCSCDAALECIRVDDDVSVSAFVYKCRRVPTIAANASNKTGDGTAS